MREYKSYKGRNPRTVKRAYTFIRQPADSQIDKIIRLYQTAGWCGPDRPAKTPN